MKLPIRFEKRNKADCFIIDADDVEIVAMWCTVEYLPKAKATLEEIVRKVNAHAELVSLLREGCNTWLGYPGWDLFAKWVKKAEQALEGEPE